MKNGKRTLETQKMKIKDLLRRREVLWKRTFHLNPAFAPAGNNLSWDKYNEAVKTAKEFENRGVYLDED